jgi:hypothetical protein
MSYAEPLTIEAEVDFKVEGAGKPCKTVRCHLLHCASAIVFSTTVLLNYPSFSFTYVLDDSARFISSPVPFRIF